ncbi:OB-fold domain-containing protein [Chloroflexota bacterium]
MSSLSLRTAVSPPPNSAFEPLFGDGSAALLIGADGAAAEIEASYYITSEFIDIWRLECDKLPRTWEDRFVLDEGYEAHIKKAFSALLKTNNATGGDFAKAAFYGPNARSHGAVAKAMGLNAQDPLFDSVGNTGAALALMTLVSALEEASPGDKLLLGNYGDGADAHIIKVGDGIAKLKDRRGMKKHLESKVMLENYGKYVKFRSLMELEQTPGMRPRTSLPAMWRDRNWQYRCHGHKCNNCGRVQFPFQKRCMYCQADSQFLEEIPLADKKGILFTFSMDERAAIVDPPNVLAAVNFTEGGRIFSQMTDRDVNAIEVGMPMEMTFRKIHDALGVHNYSWKVRPVRA